MVSKNYEAMKKTAYDCIAIDKSNGMCYWYLGVGEVFLGDIKNGKIHIKEAEKNKVGTFPYIQLAIAYLSQNDYNRQICEPS